MTTTSTLTPRVLSWNNALAISPGNLDLEIAAARIEGRVPKELFGGRMLSNGPGWNVIGGITAHPFDGHGYVRAFSFQSDGSVRFKARFVATPSYEAEAKAGHLVHRGFATNLEGPFWRNIGFGQIRNVANTTIARWNDRLLAGWEGGSPTALDAETLQTRGEEHFGGAIAGHATLAHTKHDALRDRLVVCSLERSRPARFVFREIHRDNRVVDTHAAPIPGLCFTHDFALSPNWFVLGGNPLRVKIGPLVSSYLGRGTLLNAVATNESAPAVLHLVSRGNGEKRTIKLPGPMWVVHFGNAFEEDGDVIVDACVFHQFEFGEEFGYTGPNTPFDPTKPEIRGPQRLYRITIPKGASEAHWEPLCKYGVDFPRFHPAHEGQRTPLLFGATRADTRYSDPFDSIVKVDLMDRERPPTLWSVPPNVFVGEPIFVPLPDRPNAGHVMAIVTYGLENRSALVVLDVDAMDRGPVAIVPLPLLPIAFHGDWDGTGCS